MATGQADAERAIRAAEEALVRDFNAKVTDWVTVYYTEDAHLLPPNRPIVSGRAAIRVFIQGLLDAGFGELSLETVQIGVSGDLAYHIGRLRFGRPAPDRGKFLEVWRRQPDGAWRCTADMFSSDQAPPAAP
jgi:ketosteroid isomerase-like protein